MAFSPPNSFVEVDEVRQTPQTRVHQHQSSDRNTAFAPDGFVSCLAHTNRWSIHAVGSSTDALLFSDPDSASLTASVLDYEFENGRRYHAYKAGSYPLPNDEVREATYNLHPSLGSSTVLTNSL